MYVVVCINAVRMWYNHYDNAYRWYVCVVKWICVLIERPFVCGKMTMRWAASFGIAEQVCMHICGMYVYIRYVCGTLMSGDGKPVCINICGAYTCSYVCGKMTMCCFTACEN